LEGPEGQPYDLKPAYSLCRCGKSNNKPYCDRSHLECGFVGTEAADPVSAGEPAVTGEVGTPSGAGDGLALVGVGDEDAAAYALTSPRMGLVRAFG